MRMIALGWLALVVGGCDDPGGRAPVDLPDARGAVDRGVDARAPLEAGPLDAGPLDAGPLDAAPDATVQDAAPPTPLPLTRADVVVIGPAIETDVGGGHLSDGSLVFDSSDAEFSRSSLFRVILDPAGHGAPQEIDGLSDQPIVAGPSVVEVGGEAWLYYVDGPGLDTVEVGIKRARWDGAGWGAPEAVGPLPETWLLSWPRFVAVGDGVAVAYRDWNSAPHYAWSPDGVTFEPATRLAPAGALATVAAFGDGSLVSTWQEETAERPFVARFSISRDRGATWSPGVAVTESHGNVHDTAPVLRRDGDIDLYYIYPASARGFVLFRRHLTVDGRLGPEERVTADVLGEPSKPGAARLADGALRLWWAEISARDPVQGWPTEQRLVVTRVHGDAPRAD